MTSDNAATESTPNTDEGTSAASVDEDVLRMYGSKGNLGDFHAATLEGEFITEADIAEKDVTVINFWQTSCPPCIKEMPALENLRQALPDNVQIITYCFDAPYQPEKAKSILDEAGWSGITIASSTGGLGQFIYGIKYTPTTIFVASDGTVVGSLLVGSPANLEAAYLQGINAVLDCENLAPITLDTQTTEG